jgi:hypothetical protein
LGTGVFLWVKPAAEFLFGVAAGVENGQDKNGIFSFGDLK